MSPRATDASSVELQALARHFTLLAESASERGQHDRAAKLLAQANFYRDIGDARVRRYRGRGVTGGPSSR